MIQQPRRRLSVWFYVALVAMLTNKALIEMVLNLLQQGLHLAGLH